MDTLDPHFAKKVASITSSAELQGFLDKIREDRRKNSQRLTADELDLMIKRGVELKRTVSKGVWPT